jgi:hypothetical protein
MSIGESQQSIGFIGFLYVYAEYISHYCGRNVDGKFLPHCTVLQILSFSAAIIIPLSPAASLA